MVKHIFRIMVSGAIMGIAAVGFAQTGDSTRPSLSEFEEDVAVFRRVVRQYCAVAQKMMPAPAADKAQQDKELEFLADARKLWADIQDKYADNPPAAYANDKAFKARLRDISNAVDDMRERLANGNVRRSFQACGFACGLFVQMHEQNGLNYALDKLFHLRADIKTTTAALKARGMVAVRERLPGLLQKRDVVLLAPPPYSATLNRPA